MSEIGGEKARQRAYKQIGASLARIYHFFVSIGSINEEDVRWPADHQADVDEILCQQMGISIDAIKLINKFPWPVAGSPQLIEDSPAVDYSKAYSIRNSRHPLYPEATGEEAERENHLPAHMIALTTGEPDWGCCLAVDANEGEPANPISHPDLTLMAGTIRKWYHCSGPVETKPSRPACEVLDELFQSLESLERIPFRGQIMKTDEDDEVRHYSHLDSFLPVNVRKQGLERSATQKPKQLLLSMAGLTTSDDKTGCVTQRSYLRNGMKRLTRNWKQQKKQKKQLLWPLDYLILTPATNREVSSPLSDRKPPSDLR
jgi:hypothetical protein